MADHARVLLCARRLDEDPLPEILVEEPFAIRELPPMSKLRIGLLPCALSVDLLLPPFDLQHMKVGICHLDFVGGRGGCLKSYRVVLIRRAVFASGVPVGNGQNFPLRAGPVEG